MELHERLKFLDVLAGMVWGGRRDHAECRDHECQLRSRSHGGRQAHPSTRLGRTEDHQPAAVVVIGLGIWITLIEDESSFSQTWIWLSFGLVGVSMVLGMGHFGPEGKRIDRMVAHHGRPSRCRVSGDPSADGPALLQSGVDLLILVVVRLMVFKPGL